MSSELVLKSLIIPIDSKGELFIQDRRGYKKPDWGFFGGSIEDGETPLSAVIRETKEELNIDVSEADLKYMGEFSIVHGEKNIERHLFLYKTDRANFTVSEGNGGIWMSRDEAEKHLDIDERFERIIAAIDNVVEY